MDRGQQARARPLRGAGLGIRCAVLNLGLRQGLFGFEIRELGNQIAAGLLPNFGQGGHIVSLAEVSGHIARI
jgi:hypothetical protein